MNSMQDRTQLERARLADMIRWGPTVSGVVIAAAVFATVSALWLALAAGSDDNIWRGELQWYLGFTAAGSLFLAGLLAGLFAGVRGIAAGLVNGATAWGLLFLLSLSAVIPGAFNLTRELGDTVQNVGEGSALSVGLWTSFWSLFAGAVLALLGGAVGGAAQRRSAVLGEPGPARDSSDARSGTRREPQPEYAEARNEYRPAGPDGVDGEASGRTRPQEQVRERPAERSAAAGRR